jgi:3-phenylpropionate/cinnamic acid dioxygenase small subunit
LVTGHFRRRPFIAGVLHPEIREAVMDQELIREVEQFMYREARILDERRFPEWLELLTEDLHYWMPGRSTRYPKESRALSILDRERYVEEEVSKENELAILEETKDSLSRRIERLNTGMAWAEDPPSRTRHIITNIEVEEVEADSQLKVYSNFIMYRTRAETEQDFYVGRREDVLRKENGDWKIAYRKIVLDQNVLLAKNVSNFF